MFVCAIINVSDGLVFFMMSRSQLRWYCQLEGEASNDKAEAVMFVAPDAYMYLNLTWVGLGEALWCDVTRDRLVIT